MAYQAFENPERDASHADPGCFSSGPRKSGLIIGDGSLKGGFDHHKLSDLQRELREKRDQETAQFIARKDIAPAYPCPEERRRRRVNEFEAEVEDFTTLCSRVARGVVSLTAFLIVVIAVGYWIGWHPRAPTVAFRMIEITEFKFGHGYDRTGLYTHVVTVNGRAKLDFFNPSKLYGTVTHATGTLALFREIASGKVDKFVQQKNSRSVIMLPISADMEPLFGAAPFILNEMDANEVINLHFNYEVQSEYRVFFELFLATFTTSGACDVLFVPRELVVLESVCRPADAI